MEEVLREPSQRTSCYFNCGRSSSRRKFSNHNWWLHSYRSWSGNTKPQELKSSWYWLCHVCRGYQAWWWKATRQASPLGKALSAFWKLDRVWKSRASLQQKVQLFIASALSVLLYGCESWVLTSDLCRQIDSFQTSCIRIVLGVSRTDHVTRKSMIEREQSPFPNYFKPSRSPLINFPMPFWKNVLTPWLHLLHFWLIWLA